MTNKTLFSRLRTPFKRFTRDAKGVAAVEFALIFPVMLALYLGSVEISGGLQTNKNVGKTASMVGDLITQQEDITRAELTAIAEIGEALLFPYQETSPTITMVGIQIDNNPTAAARVAWSGRYRNGAFSRPLPVGQIVNIPSRLRIPGTFIVQSRTDLDYKPIVTWTTPSGGLINMDETYYLRPRLSDTVDCTDC
ncbi:MAG: TadE/TadG family type IV pilus assembly protein [Ahrensia sp.]